MQSFPTNVLSLLPISGQTSLLDDAAMTESKPTSSAKSSSSKSAAKSAVTAETMATKQRDISVSEFFAKNRHLLGFDNPRKAVLTTVKEAVDNSLDACEEAGILPDITVVIEDLQPDRPASAKSSRYRITVVDNGPGIVRKQVENVFGRLLFGSKFHRLKMSRGQQGIGISAAGMYGLITTGKPMLIQTRPDAKKHAHHIELAMNTKTNRAEVTVDEETDDFPLARLRDLNATTRDLSVKGELLSQKDYPTGTSVTIELEGKYQRGRGSVDEFLELTAIANPHARITLIRPTRITEDEADDTPPLKKTLTSANAAEETLITPKPQAPAITQDLGPLVVFPRAVEQLPPETQEIQPHPRGVELGTLLQMLKDYELTNKGATLYNFLQEKFCRISPGTAATFCEKIGLTSRTKATDVEPPQVEKLFKEFQDSKLAPPPTDCLAPIGLTQLLKGMHKGVRAEFYAASSREPDVYRGRPFLIEAAIAFGGDLPTEDSARVIRFANRVPLLFQQSACSSFKAVTETSWKNYNLQQPRGSAPIGPMVIMIHMASVWVPFTSESKEAIADYDEIRKEMKLALMECGRKLGTYLRKRQQMRRQAERRDVFERYIGEISQATSAINAFDTKKLFELLMAQAKTKTAIADVVLDEDGKVVKGAKQAEDDGLLSDEGVLVIESPSNASGNQSSNGQSANLDDDAAEVTPISRKKKGTIRTIDQDAPAKSTSKTQAKAAKEQPEKKSRAVKASTKAPAKPNTKPTPKSTTTQTPAASSPPPSKPPAEPATKPPAKPKLRLVNGKLVPVDEPKLF